MPPVSAARSDKRRNRVIEASLPSAHAALDGRYAADSLGPDQRGI